MFVFYKKENNIEVMSLKILGVSIEFDDDLSEMPMVRNFLMAFSNNCSVTELDLFLGLEIKEADVSKELFLLIFSLHTCSNRSFSKW